MKAPQRKRINSCYLKAACVRESSVLLFGNITDPAVQESKRKIEISGRKVDVEEASLDQKFGPVDYQLGN